jgi:cystathionine beta-lyase/cystathionine gamma-synthase
VVLDAVTQVDHTVAESPLVQQLEIDADVVWEGRIAATDDR